VLPCHIVYGTCVNIVLVARQPGHTDLPGRAHLVIPKGVTVRVLCFIKLLGPKGH
jgi:hypothetical protein